jgi:hypothetical protein
MNKYLSIKDLVIQSYLENGFLPDQDELTRRVHTYFPDSAWKETHYQWYKSQINIGKISMDKASTILSKKNPNPNYQVFEKDPITLKEEFAEVKLLASKLRDYLLTEVVLNEILKTHKTGAKSQQIQNIFQEKVETFGFHSEKSGLFKDYNVQALRPDFYCPIGRSGVILEVERGKTISNNMDLLDIWKCHVCKRADFLFWLLLYRTSEKGTVINAFSSVVRRLSTFFEPENYINVEAVYVFGY